METLHRELKLMVCAMAYIEICALGNVPIHFNKLTGINMQNLAIAGNLVVHIVTVI